MLVLVFARQTTCPHSYVALLLLKSLRECLRIDSRLKFLPVR